MAGTSSNILVHPVQHPSQYCQVDRGQVPQRCRERFEVGLQLGIYGVDEAFDAPVMFTVGEFKIPVALARSFWTEKSSDEIGTTAHLFVNYQYSEDLYFKAGWEHLFTGDGLECGNLIHRYGFECSGGTDDDAHHYYLEAGLKF